MAIVGQNPRHWTTIQVGLGLLTCSEPLAAIHIGRLQRISVFLTTSSACINFVRMWRTGSYPHSRLCTSGTSITWVYGAL